MADLIGTALAAAAITSQITHIAIGPDTAATATATGTTEAYTTTTLLPNEAFRVAATVVKTGATVTVTGTFTNTPNYGSATYGFWIGQIGVFTAASAGDLLTYSHRQLVAWTNDPAVNENYAIGYIRNDDTPEWYDTSISHIHEQPLITIIIGMQA